MKKLKTLSAVLLTAVGGIVCAVGALALFVWADMVIKEFGLVANDKEEKEYRFGV